MTGDSAYVRGLAAAVRLPGGGLSIEPEQPSAEVKEWLVEHGYTYSHFEPDTSALGRQMSDVYAVEGDPEAVAVWGRIVFQRD